MAAIATIGLSNKPPNKINYEEIASGIEKKIKIKHSVVAPGAEFITCPTCHGQGQVTQVSNTILGQMRSSTVCPHCEGSGKRIGNRPLGAGPDGMIKKDETIKIGIIGVGHLGNFHINQLKGISEISISGIYDIDINRAQEMSLCHNVKSYPYLEEVLKLSDAVCIVTPTKSHYSVANKALDYNCHLFRFCLIFC